MHGREYSEEYKNLSNCSIAVIGLGYVGLPLAVAFAKNRTCAFSKNPLNRNVVGFDVNEKRIDELNKNFDKTNEISRDDFEKCKGNLIFTNNKSDLENTNIFIITVPTPVNQQKNPDLSHVKNATKLVAEVINKQFNIYQLKNIKPLIIYESTVYPGVTEDICNPIIEKITSKKINHDFFLGYSPERINPGDTKNTLETIVKVTSGSNEESSKKVDYLYRSIIRAGTHNVSSIKIAEACKVIENTQRDLNIAFINELSMIFRALDISTLEVLEAAKTKWNFLDFKPGLVGGHCIGIDPYYLTFRSKQIGVTPRLISSARKINDGMAKWIVDQLILEMAKRKFVIGGERVLILGFSYKENCGDHRNSRVIDIINSLKVFNLKIDVVDGYVDVEECMSDYSIKILREIPEFKYSAVIVAVSHAEFKSLSTKEWENIVREDGIIFDVKGICPDNCSVIKM